MIHFYSLYCKKTELSFSYWCNFVPQLPFRQIPAGTGNSIYLYVFA